MIEIRVTDEQIAEAKKLTEMFDKQKRHDKFKCDHNWIGVLGEIVLFNWFEQNKIEAEWLEFVKQDWNDPDFKIGKHSVDIKTTTGSRMRFQEPKFDIYIHARYCMDRKLLILVAWQTGKILAKKVKSGSIIPEKRENGGYDHFAVPYKQMNLIFSEEFKEKCLLWATK